MFDLLGGDLPVPAACGTEELVELLAAHARVEAMAAQRKLAVAAELYRRRSAEDAAAGVVCSRTGEFTVAEVAVGLTVSKGVASGFLDVGTALDERLPATKHAFARWELDYTRVRVIVERTAHLEEHLVAVVEEQILDKALAPGRELIRARLGSVIDRIILAVDPGGARERRRRAEGDRDVQIRPDADGMCSLWGALRGVDGRVLQQRLRDMALGVCGSDPRSMAQRRADALTALALGADHLVCACTDPGCPCAPEAPPRPRVLIQVMIDAATLAGVADLPGVLAGFGVVDPHLVRQLAADASWQQLLTDTRGTVTGVGPTTTPGCVPPPDTSAAARRCSPSRALGRLVRARDGHCRFPGCGVAARDCDLDHILAFNHIHPETGGPTTAANLQCLCRWHHRPKTRGDWQVTALPGAIMRWSSPTGTLHDTHPAGGTGTSHHDTEDTDRTATGDIGGNASNAGNGPGERQGKRPVWEPARAEPSRYADPHGDDPEIPDPWAGFDWRTINDPLSTAEYEHLLHDTRFDKPPPDPEAPSQIQVVVTCDCPPPF